MNKQRYANIAVYLSFALKILGMFLGFATIFMLVWKVFGHSPTSDSVMIFAMSLLSGLVCANLTLTFKIVFELGKVKSDVANIKRVTYSLARDFRKHQDNMH